MMYIYIYIIIHQYGTQGNQPYRFIDSSQVAWREGLHLYPFCDLVTYCSYTYVQLPCIYNSWKTHEWMRSFTPPKPCSYFPASSKGVKIKHVEGCAQFGRPSVARCWSYKDLSVCKGAGNEEVWSVSAFLRLMKINEVCGESPVDVDDWKW